MRTLKIIVLILLVIIVQTLLFIVAAIVFFTGLGVGLQFNPTYGIILWIVAAAIFILNLL